MGSDDVQPGRSDGEDELRDQTVDEMFAEIMAGFHLTAPGHDPPAPPALPPSVRADGASEDEPTVPITPTNPMTPSHPIASTTDREPAGDEPVSWTPRTGADWVEDHPLFARPGPRPEPERFERYRPDPQPPMGLPRWPVLLGWACMVWALVAALLVIFGVHLPSWSGWIAVLGFLGGFALLISQLPRHRPPDSGDGAVL